MVPRLPEAPAEDQLWKYLTSLYIFHLSLSTCHHLFSRPTLFVMPPPTSSLKPNVVGKNAAAKQTNGTASKTKEAPVPAAVGVEDGDKKSSWAMTKPDQANYNAEQDTLNKGIAAIKVKLVSFHMLTESGAQEQKADWLVLVGCICRTLYDLEFH